MKLLYTRVVQGQVEFEAPDELMQRIKAAEGAARADLLQEVVDAGISAFAAAERSGTIDYEWVSSHITDENDEEVWDHG